MTPRTPFHRYIMLALSVLIACSSPAKNELTDADRAYLHSLIDREPELLMGKQWDSLTACYTHDAVRLPPNGLPIRGKDSIRQLFNSLPTIKAFHFHVDDLQGDDRFAYMRGTYDIHLSPDGVNDIKDTGKSLIVFRKDPNGSWLSVVDAWSSNLPPTK